LLTITAAVLALTAALAAHGQTAKVVQGQIKGRHQGTVDVFLGVPFAAPPIGRNRWRAPQPAPSWTGLRMADKFAASCQQDVAPAGFGPWTHEYVVQDAVSEDCLYLNVWTPASRAAQRLPVLFWIHGGGFSQGSGSVPIYDGAALAARGVVVVSINYRLGAFGFLAHPELTEEAGTSGNYGIQDMVAALEWVQANISAFGGDPRRVTVAGQSAGAASVHDLIACPAAKGLFSLAIAQSGSGMGLPVPTLRTAERDGEQLAIKAGAKSIAELRSLSPDAILKAVKGDSPMAGLRFAPIVDGNVLPHDPNNLQRGTASNDVAVLTGLTADEGSAMTPSYGKVTNTELKQRLEKAFGAMSVEANGIYAAADDAQAGEYSKTLVRDRGIAAAYRWAIQWTANTGKPVFLYLFTHTEPGAQAARYGAFHSAEIPYVFQTFDKSPERPFSALDRQLSVTMASYWINFVKTGNPNGAGLPEWPAFDAKSPTLMELGDKPSAQPVLTPQKRKLYDSYVASGGKLGLF